MQELKLYTTKQNLKYAGAIAAGCLVIGPYLLFLSRSGLEHHVLAIVAICYGLWTGVATARQWSNPTPIFEADNAGFSVKGKAKRPWDEYRGAVLHLKRTGGSIFSTRKAVRVKVGKSMMGGYVQISPLQMSATPERMLVQIEEFAHEMKMMAAGQSVGLAQAARQMSQEKYHVPPLDGATDPFVRPMDDSAAPIPTAAPVFEKRPSFAERLSEAGSNPVETVPSFGERLFGRRKVI